MKFVDGIAYREIEGTGTPLVFIHGWLGSNKSWKLVEQNLGIENPLIFLDQRCHGESDCSKFSIKKLAIDLEKIVKEICEKPPIIIGHSMGGMTALKYASLCPNYKALCLIGTSASTPEPKLESPKFFLDKFDEITREKWAEKIATNYLGDTNQDKLRKATELELRDAKEKPIRYGLKAMIDYDVRDKLDIKKPSLVVAADKDGAITMEKSQELATIIGCQIKEIDSGHLMLHERPKKIAEIITDFVRKNEAK